MKIVKLKGGLGNQLFQYSFARLLGETTNEEIKLDYSSYKTNNNDKVRLPRITNFNIRLESCNEIELSKILYFRRIGLPNSLMYKAAIWFESKFNDSYFLSPRGYVDPNIIKEYSYYDGYWQSIRFINPVKHLIIKELTPKYEISQKTKDTLSYFQENNTVFIGIRRGDYLKEKELYGSFDSSYYIKAMDYISCYVKNPLFVVFSNDIKWCQTNMNWGRYKPMFRIEEEQTNDFEELLLMSNCKHAIIINSTFHWWGAFLIKNREKIVCCPKKWFYNTADIDIYPDQWIKL